MSRSLIAMCVVGSLLTIYGSFLPWVDIGYFVPGRVYGIQLQPESKDNGSLLKVPLTVVAGAHT